MNKGVVIFVVVVCASLVVSIGLSTMNKSGAVEPQPPIPVFPTCFVDVEEPERGLLIEKAINDPEVKEYLVRGYEIYKVQKYQDDINQDVIYGVLILTQMQRLPWVLGISLKAQVDFVEEGALVIQFYLTLANLTDSQEEQVKGIATSYVAETYGTDYSIENDAEVNSWQEGGTGRNNFYAYPCARFRVPSDWSESGSLLTVYVDLEKREVAKVHSYPSKPMPPPPPEE